MTVTETPIAGVWIVDTDPVVDERGSFARSWCARDLGAVGIDTAVAQMSISHTTTRGTIRGLHWQTPPHGETKVVRCIRGSLFDVAVDLRPDSPTFRQWFGAELSASNRRALALPQGVAHGFQTLDDDTEILYVISAFYEPTSASGARFDDPVFDIAWPLGTPTVISQRDLSWPSFDPMTGIDAP